MKNKADNFVALDEYASWLKIKKERLYYINKKRIGELKNFYSLREKPKDLLLRQFFKWIKENDSKIEAVIMWGSYCKGAESERSFNRYKHKGKEDLLTFGPSDVDALVFGGSSLKLPRMVGKYKILNSNLKIIREETLNLFRDAFIIPSDKMEEVFTDRKEDYICGFVYSYFNNGAVIKTSPKIDRFFEEMKKGRKDYVKISEAYFKDKICWFEQFLFSSGHSDKII